MESTNSCTLERKEYIEKKKKKGFFGKKLKSNKKTSHIPPGEVTSSLNWPGCFPDSRTILADPKVI